MPADPIEIRGAPDAEAIARRVIAEHHPHLAHPEDVRILYAFTNQRRSSRGKVVLATTQKLTPLMRWLEGGREQIEDGADFLVLISLLPWAVMSDAQKEALIDHELCHIACDVESDTYTLRPHDVEDFTDVIERRGLWKPDLEPFAKAAASQLSLLDPELIRTGVYGAA